MKTTTFIPDHYQHTYVLNQEKKTFREYLLSHAENPLLTDLVRIEKNNGYNSITGAEYLLRVRNTSNWSKCALTGLRPTATTGFYYSDLLVNNVKSLIVVFMPQGGEKILLRVCKQFYPHTPSDRERIIKAIIQKF